MYLKKQGHTVAMTGDGVNDVLALKESDCAISIKSATDAARNVSQLILLNDDFNSLPNVVAEGRQTINNVERSASLLLVKTLYTILLILFSIIVSQKYFFIPIQLTFITAFTIGTPSFILALEPNNELVSGNFLLKVLAKALPTALTVVFNVALVTAFSELFELSYELQSTLSVYVTTITGLIYLYKICNPFTVLRGSLFFTMFLGFTIGALVIPDFFNLLHINYTIVLIVFVLSIDSLYIYKTLNYIITKIFNRFDKSIAIESDFYKEKKVNE
jgi:cation-transporting ATPase E